MPEQSFHLHQKLSDFDEFCVNARHWDLDFRQLDSGRFHSELLMSGNASILFTRARLGRRMQQRGTPPRGLVTFGLMADPKINIYWRNIDISGDQLFIFPPGGELHSVTQADFDVYVISLSEDKLDRICDSCELPCFQKMIDRNEVFDCNPQHVSALRRWLLTIERELTTCDHCIRHHLYLEKLEHEMAIWLIRILAESRQDEARRSIRKRDRALQTAENYIHESGNTVVSIAELCKACNVSERTLEYAFRERFDLTPKAYTLIYRLNSVRKQLRMADAGNEKVSIIALQHGFWRMGQFSASYHKLFAELPSQTLKKG